MSPLFQAVIEATEEAIYNSLIMATTVTGHRGRVVEALPLDRRSWRCLAAWAVRATIAPEPDVGGRAKPFLRWGGEEAQKPLDSGHLQWCAQAVDAHPLGQVLEDLEALPAALKLLSDLL